MSEIDPAAHGDAAALALSGPSVSYVSKVSLTPCSWRRGLVSVLGVIALSSAVAQSGTDRDLDNDGSWDFKEVEDDP